MSYIRTYSGKNFDLSNLSVDSFDIESIAQGLSNTCRYSGQCQTFYSVAEHSVRVALAAGALLRERNPQVSKKELYEVALWALLHDASEAYLPDMPSPFKRLPELEGFRTLEAKIMAGIIEKFNLLPEEPAVVKEADTRIIMNERDGLVNMDNGTWDVNVQPLPKAYICLDSKPDRDYWGLTPDLAKLEFMYLFDMLYNELSGCATCANKCTGA